jgi:hypothetical protein
MKRKILKIALALTIAGAAIIYAEPPIPDCFPCDDGPGTQGHCPTSCSTLSCLLGLCGQVSPTAAKAKK